MDRAALEAAREANLETGGYCPLNFMTTDGPDEKLKDYGLIEVKANSLALMYVLRSKKNVDMSDVTIIFRLYPSVGTDKTVGYCLTGEWKILTEKEIEKVDKPYRHCLIIYDIDIDKEEIIEFIREYKPKVINVAGHREKDIELKVKNKLREVFMTIKNI